MAQFEAPYVPTLSGKPKRLAGWHIVLIVIGAIAFAIVAPCFLLWAYLFVSLAPRPWHVRNAPLPAIHAAAQAGDIDAIKRCLQAGDSIDLQVFENAQWSDGMTPLMIAARQGDAATTEALLDLGAAIELADAHGERAIHWAAPGALEILLREGADINARTRHGQTPLMRAAIRARGTKDLRAIRLLLDAGADVNATDKQGYTAIGVLRTWPDPDPEVIKMLEEAGGK